MSKDKAPRVPTLPLQPEYLNGVLSSYRARGPSDIAQRLKLAGIDTDAEAVELALMDLALEHKLRED